MSDGKIVNPSADLSVLRALGWSAADQHRLDDWRDMRIASDPNPTYPDIHLARVIAVERTGLTVAPRGLLPTVMYPSAAAGFAAMRKRGRPLATG